jgi:hypothetical protein
MQAFTFARNHYDFDVNVDVGHWFCNMVCGVGRKKWCMCGMLLESANLSLLDQELWRVWKKV